MLKQGSVSDIRSHTLSRKDGYIAVCMAYYPRGLKKELMDEFRSDLAPDRELFTEWKVFEKSAGHAEAFKLSNYEARFHLGPIGLHHLKKYAEESRVKDLFMICQCRVGERCHREMLLLMAEKKYGAAIDKIHNEYPVWEKRIPEIDDTFRFG